MVMKDVIPMDRIKASQLTVFTNVVGVISAKEG
jgi:hypothetical protein